MSDLWYAWRSFRRGKKASRDIDHFAYRVEAELALLQKELMDGSYLHGTYRTFMVTDNKRRMISVASVRDRVVHRLLYDYLVRLYDTRFLYDVWSCRKEKGLTGAIDRLQDFVRAYADGAVWTADVRKFFDSVDHATLCMVLSWRVRDQIAIRTLREVIRSYRTEGIVSDRHVGIPIGNVCSQVFANIYLHELDHFVAHTIRPLAYARYGDDFFVFTDTYFAAVHIRERVTAFLKNALHLEKMRYIGNTPRFLKRQGTR